MNIHVVLFALALVPAAAVAQSPASVLVNEPPNAITRTVLLANRPEKFTVEQWLRMMEQPANRTLYALRVPQAMLDTLDATQLDNRYRYAMVPGEK